MRFNLVKKYFFPLEKICDFIHNGFTGPYIFMPKNRLSAFTLVELLIVVSIIAILAGIMFMGNIQRSFQKGRDVKRKTDLNKMVTILEDYYNDKERYPGSDVNGNITEALWGEPFLPYASSLPQDPLAPNRQYYYITDNNGLYYVIYAKLENTDDPDIERVGCKYGCAPPSMGTKDYTYVVHSPNLTMIAGLPSAYDTFGGGNVFPTSGGGGGNTPTPPPPTPTTVPGACSDNECCCNRWCGAFSPPQGVFCVAQEKCLYDNLYLHWTCGNNQGCPPC